MFPHFPSLCPPTHKLSPLCSPTTSLVLALPVTGCLCPPTLGPCPFRRPPSFFLPVSHLCSPTRELSRLRPPAMPLALALALALRRILRTRKTLRPRISRAPTFTLLLSVLQELLLRVQQPLLALVWRSSVPSRGGVTFSRAFSRRNLTACQWHRRSTAPASLSGTSTS